MSGKFPLFKITGVVLAFFVVVAVAVSCRSSEKMTESTSAVESVKVDGVEVFVWVSAPSIRTSERLSLTLTVQSDPNYQIQLPEVPEKLGSFFVLESQTASPRLNDAGQIVIERVYTLEPDQPGVAEIPEFLVVAIPDDAPKRAKFQIQSKPAIVNVLSVLNAGEGNVKKSFRDIAPDTRSEVVVRSHRWPLVALISNVVVVLCLLVVWLKWKKSGKNANSDPEREWVDLASARPEEKRRRVESVVSAWVAKRFALPLRAVDFQGVNEEFCAKELEVSGWHELVARWNQFQYGAKPSTDGEIEGLYQMWDAWMRALPDQADPVDERKESDS